jgi:hypothetical protein
MPRSSEQSRYSVVTHKCCVVMESCPCTVVVRSMEMKTLSCWPLSQCRIRLSGREEGGGGVRLGGGVKRVWAVLIAVAAAVRGVGLLSSSGSIIGDFEWFGGAADPSPTDHFISFTLAHLNSLLCFI